MKQWFFILKLTMPLLICTTLNMFSQDNSFVLITMLYNEVDPQRIVEYKTCLIKNMKHDLIEDIHVLYDTSKDYADGRGNEMRGFLEYQQIPVTEIKGRPTYADIFKFANQMYPDKKIILANADIYFNETLHKLESFKRWPNSLFALTRWNVQNDHTTLRLEGFEPGIPNELSADTWIFKTPFIPFIGSDRIHMASYACDHALAYAAKEAGLSVVNPCASIQTCHLHVSQIRNYYVDEQTVAHAQTFGSSPVMWSYLQGYEKDWADLVEQISNLKPYNNTTVTQDPFVLITMLYNETIPDRIQEYKTCLLKNKQLDIIDRIHVLYDTSRDYRSTKDFKNGNRNEIFDFLEQEGISYSLIQGRATYGECFELANDLFPYHRVIIANADIYFNESLNKLALFDEWDDIFFALTRWNIKWDGNVFLEHIPGGEPNYDSQDAWIFKTPMAISNHMYGIYMGTLGCDNGIAYEVDRQGYTVLNPCASIQAYHLHLSDIRHYDKDNMYPGPKIPTVWTWLSLFPDDQDLLEYEIEKLKTYGLFYKNWSYEL